MSRQDDVQQDIQAAHGSRRPAETESSEGSLAEEVRELRAALARQQEALARQEALTAELYEALRHDHATSRPLAQPQRASEDEARQIAEGQAPAEECGNTQTKRGGARRTGDACFREREQWLRPLPSH